MLERNERYWGTKPAIQRATYTLFPEDGAEQMLAAYEAGEIDTTGAGVGSSLPASQIDRIMADPVLSQQLKNFKQSGTYMLIVNHRKPHFQDVRVRKAIGMALEPPRAAGRRHQAGRRPGAAASSRRASSAGSRPPGRRKTSPPPSS